jgi:hypothetical protein
MSYSNYGKRVNVQGHGECATSSGFGNLYAGSDANSWYTNTFDGTSSASALVAAVAASLSSSYKQVNSGKAPSVPKLRSMLIQSGTAQDLTGNIGNIGPLPNLAAAQKLTDTTKPSAPTTLTTTLTASNTVSLKWAGAKDNAGIAKYYIYRNGKLFRTLAATSYIDTTVKRGTTYKYYIVAVDLSGNISANSVTRTVTTKK